MAFNVNFTQWSPDYFKENEMVCLNHLEKDTIWNSIPLMNARNSHNFENMRLVRFRGMIQDMYDPEFYFESCEVKHKDTNETFMSNGKYMDRVTCKDNDTILFDSSKNVTKERNVYVVISIPALNPWAESLETQLESMPINDTKELCGSKSLKRNLELEEMEVEPSTSQNNEICKKSFTSENISNKAVEDNNFYLDLLFNYPIPKTNSKTCFLKIYNESDTLKLNEIVEFIGFLFIDLSLSEIDMNNFENKMEIQVHHPPSSLIPRIHCVSWKKLIHTNPLLLTTDFQNNQIMEIRNELLFVLTSVLFGDELTAEYLICHLISKVYSRLELQAIGKFSLNISNLPVDKHTEYSKELYVFLQEILVKSHFFQMTIDNINEANFIPKKNYECNRLNSALLQLSSNTHLIVDETKLTTGELNTKGVHNMKALSDVVKNQRIGYDFVYHQLDYDCDIPILVLSKEKSLVPSDIQVPLQPTQDVMDMTSETFDATKKYLKPKILDDIRMYLTTVRHREYQILDDVQQLIEEEFVKMRKTYNATADDLHNLIVLTRLLCLSEGRNKFDIECWNKACKMENTRKDRIKALK